MGNEEAPVVSVVIPTYNRAGEFRRSVDSVIAQTYRPLQLVIVDDGSTDHTREVMKQLQEEVNAAGISPLFINQQNAGVSAARNTGLRAATGDYIAFLDDDDTWVRQKLELQINELQRTGADACCCYITREQPDVNLTVPGEGKDLLEGFHPGHFISGRTYAHIISLVVEAQVCRQAGDMDTSLVLSQDIEWLGRVVHLASFCAVNETLATNTYSMDGASRIRGIEDLLRRDRFMIRVLDLWRERNCNSPHWDEEAWKARVARDYEQFVKHQLYAGNLKRAAELFEKGLRLAGACEELRRAQRKMRKARWLRLIGRRVTPAFSAQ